MLSSQKGVSALSRHLKQQNVTLVTRAQDVAVEVALGLSPSMSDTFAFQ